MECNEFHSSKFKRGEAPRTRVCRPCAGLSSRFTNVALRCTTPACPLEFATTVILNYIRRQSCAHIPKRCIQLVLREDYHYRRLLLPREAAR